MATMGWEAMNHTPYNPEFASEIFICSNNESAPKRTDISN
jgi:hypothetical protein